MRKSCLWWELIHGWELIQRRHFVFESSLGWSGIVAEAPSNPFNMLVQCIPQFRQQCFELFVSFGRDGPRAKAPDFIFQTTHGGVCRPKLRNIRVFERLVVFSTVQTVGFQV